VPDARTGRPRGRDTGTSAAGAVRTAVDLDDPLLAQLPPRTLAALLATAGDVVVVLDLTGLVRHVLVSGMEHTVDNVDSWTGRPFADAVTSETRPKVEALLRDVMTTGVSRRRQVNHPSTGGSDVPMAYTAIRPGRSDTVVFVGRDMRHVSALQQRLVEAQQSMERDYWRLRHVETRYRLLFQLASDGILVVDAATLRVLDANAAAADVFGEVTDRLLGRTFPFGVEPKMARVLEDMLAAARASGRAGDVTITLTRSEQAYRASASCFRQDASTMLLVRLSAAALQPPARQNDGDTPRLVDLIERSPDAFVVTDLDGHILTANRAFLDVSELTSLEQARGELFGTFVGRPGADFPVFLSMLKRHGAVRLAATSARGAHGGSTEVEVSAVWVADGDEPYVGFVLRDIGRRLASGPQGARDLTRAVEELTGLVGRVSLRDLVRDTVDLVERHFIEAALELTDDNRTSAAEVLGVSRQSLYVKLRRHRLLASASDREADPPS
jgi:transcriptional regulator PpsR